MAAHDALRTILPAAGWPEDRGRSVEITGGGDPVLPTPFRIGETSAAAIAATGLAVADLWELRTGQRQEVAVDLRHATASLRSGTYLQVNGVKVRGDRNPVMGMYPAKNGRWSYIHANFPNHRAAALKVLGCEETRDAVRRPRRPGIRHRARQTVGPARPAPAGGPEHAEKPGARGRRLQPGISARNAQQSRVVARAAGGVAPGHRLCLALRVQPCGP